MTKYELKTLLQGLDSASKTRNRINRFKGDLKKSKNNATLTASLTEKLQELQKHLNSFSEKPSKNVVLPNYTVGFCKTAEQAADIREKENTKPTDEEIREQIRKAKALLNSTGLCSEAKAALQKRFKELGSWSAIYDAEQNKGKQQDKAQTVDTILADAIKELFNLRRLANIETMGAYGHDFNSIETWKNYLLELHDKSAIRYDKPSREWSLEDPEQALKINSISGLTKKASFMPQSWLRPLSKFHSDRVRLVQKVDPWDKGILNLGGNRVTCLEKVFEQNTWSNIKSKRQWFFRLRFIDLGEGSPVYYEIIEEIAAKTRNRKEIKDRIKEVPRLTGDALRIYNEIKEIALNERQVATGITR